MLEKKIQDIDSIDGGEETTIRQIFHPHNTLNGIRYSISHSELKPSKKSKLHKLKSSEIYYILQGEGNMLVEDESIKVSQDQVIYIPPHSKQMIENTGNIDLKFLCIVDPAWKQDDEIILE